MNQALLEAIRQSAHPLRTHVADACTRDLQPLKEMLSGVRIIGLGESTHGTREIFQLKHRLTRFLVEEMGFRVFSIEAGIEPCRAIDDYVMMGKGDKYRALSAQGYWTWDTAEVMDMIDWMREHNLRCRRGDECRFFGFDMKPIEGACDALLDFLHPLAGGDFSRLEEIVMQSRGTVWMSTGQSIPDIFYLLGWLRAHEYELIDGSCPQAYQLALENAHYIFQYISCMAGYVENPAAPYRDRDFYMAENVTRLLDTLPAGSKLIVWAHNAHIAVDEEWKNLGWELRQRYGSLYYPCAIGFGAGGFQSRLMSEQNFEDIGGMVMHSLCGFSVDAPVPGSWDEDLNTAFSHSAYLDLRTQLRNNVECRAWLAQKKPLLSIGATYNPAAKPEQWAQMFCQNCVLGESFDGLFFLKSVQRARPNINGQR